jgi:hypothetical protein
LNWRKTTTIIVLQAQATVSRRTITETTVNRDVFTGNQSPIGAMHTVKADCSSRPIPVLRVITAPQNGEYRFEETTYADERKPGDSRAACNGKNVDAVGVHYKSKADFTGADNIVIDVDFKDGTVRLYNSKITVR